MKISLIGKTIADGLYATIDIGVNPNARVNVAAVNTWTADGGKPIPGSPWAGYPDTCRYCGFRPPMGKKSVEEDAEVLDAE
jgi:hypothetical protein